MMKTLRLSRLSDVTGDATLPGYDPTQVGKGIVHIGPGAFHRAHQAVYTDAAIAAAGGDWRITGLSLRGTQTADVLNTQNGLFTCIERGAAGSRGRVVGSIANVITAVRDPKGALASLTDPNTQIVTLTVTEKAYGINRSEMTVDPDHPVVAADLMTPHAPSGVLGMLSESLRLRRRNGTDPFTVLCCDNLPENGKLLRAAVIGFARLFDKELAEWISAEAAFPCSMVDRITPASTDQTRVDACGFTGCEDLAAVESEAFSQWVIEDRFVTDRPQWEAGGALFVADVVPYEHMKLRMLNGCHSMLAYTGFLAGRRFIRDTMADADLRFLAGRHFRAAAATLRPISGFDFERYACDLTDRFANPSIEHETYQIAMDGTEKLPQRLIAPAADALASDTKLRPFVFATAAWMRYCLGQTDTAEPYDLRDPREDEIATCLSGAATADDISDRLHRLPGLFDAALVNNSDWRRQVASTLQVMLSKGMAAAIAHEADDCRKNDTKC